jgi:hypothetical protein
MSKAYISQYQNPQLFKLKNTTVEMLIHGLKPNTEHAFYEEDTINLTEHTLQISKGTNFQTVYDNYLNNNKSANKDSSGVTLPHNSDHINRKILFEDFNFINSTTRTEDVITIGNIGDPLVTDENGMLAFYFYVPESSSSDELKRTKLKFDNYEAFLNKKYTIKTQELIQKAQTLATENSNQAIETQHIVDVILSDEDNLVLHAIKKIGLTADLIQRKMKEAISKLPKVTGVEHGQYLGKYAQAAAIKSESLMKEFQDSFVSPESLFLAILMQNDETSRILKENGIKESEFKKAIIELRGSRKSDSDTSEMTFDALGKYAINLNSQAEKGKQIGRASCRERV